MIFLTHAKGFARLCPREEAMIKYQNGTDYKSAPVEDQNIDKIKGWNTS